VQLQADFAARARNAFGCAELIVTGPRLAAVKARLDDTVYAEAPPHPSASPAMRYWIHTTLKDRKK
jgi:hypothetical protein